MLEFISKCPHCQTSLQIQNELCGKLVTCPVCAKIFQVEKPVIDNDKCGKVQSGNDATFLIICIMVVFLIVGGIFVAKHYMVDVPNARRSAEVNSGYYSTMAQEAYEEMESTRLWNNAVDNAKTEIKMEAERLLRAWGLD